jgi:hypothetical protein
VARVKNCASVIFATATAQQSASLVAFARKYLAELLFERASVDSLTQDWVKAN